jgi:2-polyprenyl-6-methoxyphenol hydroxylase-like FAD-dependent oxidoreductase
MSNDSEQTTNRFRTLDRDSSIAIIGGSLTGPVLLLLLRRAGFGNVTVYEATPSNVSQAGGVIGLDHVALGVLDSIGVQQGEVIPFPSERVVSVKVADRREAGRVHTLYPGRNTTWSLLHSSLARRLPVGTFKTGKRLTGFSSDELDRAVLDFGDGERVTADLVAFADGRRSLGRKVLDPERPLRYAGYVAHRGQLDYCPDDVRDFVRYEPTGTQFNVFPVPLPNGRIGLDWTFYLNTSPEGFREQFGASPTARTFVLPHQISDMARQGVDLAADRLLPAAVAELVHRTTMRMAAPVVDIAPPERMLANIGDSAAVMIGDALAPVRPHTARGLNNGIDQAAGLVTALTQHRKYGADLEAALTGWQARYLPQVADTLRRGPQLAHTIGLGQ